jgi:hypothetical protein
MPEEEEGGGGIIIIIVTDIYCSMVNIIYACQCCCQFRREEKSG